MVCTAEMTTGSPVCVPSSSIRKTCRDEIRCIAVGDAHSGKNHLLAACEKIDSDKEQTVFVEYSTCKLYNDINHKVVFKGFSGQEKYHNLRRLSYTEPTGVFLVCFSVVDREQFENATDNWIREIKNYAPESPYLLIGTHTDLRKDPDYRQRLKMECKTVITRKEAKRKAFIHNCKYLECSSTTLEGVKRVFNAAIEAALQGDYAEALRRRVCQMM